MRQVLDFIRFLEVGADEGNVTDPFETLDKWQFLKEKQLPTYILPDW